MKTHIIVFFDESKKLITTEQFNYIISKSDGKIDGLNIENQFIRFSSIQKILSVDEFNEHYPKERIDLPLPILKQLEGRGLEKTVNLAKQPKHILSMLKGFDRAIKEQNYPISEPQQTLRKRMTDRLKDWDKETVKGQFIEIFGDTPEVREQAEGMFA